MAVPHKSAARWSCGLLGKQECLCEQEEEVSQKQAYTQVDQSCVDHFRVPLTNSKGQQSQEQEEKSHRHGHCIEHVQVSITLKKDNFEQFENTVSDLFKPHSDVCTSRILFLRFFARSQIML